MYHIIFKPDHNSEMKEYKIKSKYDRDSVISTLMEMGSLIFSTGYSIT